MLHCTREVEDRHRLRSIVQGLAQDHNAKTILHGLPSFLIRATEGALKSIFAASGGCDAHDSINAITFNDKPLHRGEPKLHGGEPKSKWELPANP